MKILYCINATYNSGGMERVLMTKANYLADVVGYEIFIVTAQQHGRNSFFPFSKRILFHDLGIDYDADQNENLFVRTIRKWRKKRKHKRLLGDYLHEVRPDIAISMFDYEFSFLHQIKDGSKKVLEFHFCKKQKIIEATNVFMRTLQALRVMSWKRIVSKYDKFVVLTEEDKLAWGNLSNIMVIKNPIPKMPGTKALLNTKQVLSVGRISYQKGFDRLIKVWALIVPHYPDWRLLIRGNGDSTQLQKLIRQLGIDKHVKIASATPNIAEEYLSSSVYAMTSRYEGLPMVLMEAMSYGLPCVSFACPCGPTDLIQSSYGSLVPDNDIKGFAVALMDWMKNDEKRKAAGEKAREFISQYTQERIVEQWLNLFDSLIK